MDPLGTNMNLLKRYRPSDSFCTFISLFRVYWPITIKYSRALECSYWPITIKYSRALECSYWPITIKYSRALECSYWPITIKYSRAVQSWVLWRALPASARVDDEAPHKHKRSRHLTGDQRYSSADINTATNGSWIQKPKHEILCVIEVCERSVCVCVTQHAHRRCHIGSCQLYAGYFSLSVGCLEHKQGHARVITV